MKQAKLCVVVGLVLLRVVPSAFGAPARDTFRAEGGVFATRNEKSAVYYRVIYQGASLAEYGEAQADSASRVAPLPGASLTIPEGADLSLKFERGRLDVGGDLITATGIKPLGQLVPRLGRLRGTAQAFARMDGKTAQYAVGLETPPVHPLAIARAERWSVMNRMMLGVQAERRDGDAGNGSLQEGGVAQARWYVGKAWGDAKPLDSQVVARQAIRDEIFAHASNLKEGEHWLSGDSVDHQKEWVSQLEQVILFHKRKWSKLEKLEAKRLAEDPKEWRRIVDAIAKPENIASDHTRVVVAYEGSVRREFGDSRLTDAWLPYMRAEVKWWPTPRTPENGWFTLAYVNGFDRADRGGGRRDQLLATFGVEF